MWRAGLLVLLVLVSGCAGTTLPQGAAPPTDAPATTTASTATTSSTTTAAATGTTTAGPTATTTAPTTTAPPTTSTETGTTTAPTTTTAAPSTATDNPWGKPRVVVAVENEAGNAHLRYDQFRAALDYWEANAPRYAGYHVRFVLDPDAADPDVTIQYVERIDQCGDTPSTGTTLGCAPLYRSGHVRDHTVVQIRENDDDVQLVATTKHEFGHVLGIGHGEEPMPLMAEDDLYLHASPWNRSAVRYYLDLGDGPGVDQSTIEAQVDPAFRFFEGGADGTLRSPPTFVRVQNRSAANVVVEVHAGPRPGDAFEGSVIESRYEGSIEGQLYARYTVAMYDLDIEAMGWHVAYQLAGVLVEDDGAYPSVLDPAECGYHCRRGDWWT